MPKINVYASAATGDEQTRRVEVGWHQHGIVQVGATKRSPFPTGTSTLTVGPDQTATATTSAEWAWDGEFVDLDRAGLNHLIRALREARDKAYGRDE